jgi:hypothetical protein
MYDVRARDRLAEHGAHGLGEQGVLQVRQPAGDRHDKLGHVKHLQARVRVRAAFLRVAAGDDADRVAAPEERSGPAHGR